MSPKIKKRMCDIMPEWKKYGKYYIDQEGVKQYRIKKGNSLYGKNGQINSISGEDKIYKKDWLKDTPEDGTINLDGGVMLKTSEILDFAEGTDSTP
ncbi:MAG TPA: hypothetical protein GXZ52_05705 [Clostridiales bacterium]|nr:hypothetical protein [Clostridiales bacterium]